MESYPSLVGHETSNDGSIDIWNSIAFYSYVQRTFDEKRQGANAEDYLEAKEPGPAFREDFDKFPILYDGMERVLCPRVHFKIIVFDCQEVYIGSANLTGAGIGMKGEGTRNFEAGILTDAPDIVEHAMNQFDDVWIGKMCKGCKRRDFCGDPIDKH